MSAPGRPLASPVPGGGARQAVAFLTPLGGAAAPSRSALGWFPAVGAALGAVLGVVWWSAAKAWPALVVAGIVVALDLALTGMLHLDGVVDSADGLLPHLRREKRLEVMREPAAGAFGMVGAVVVLLLRFTALATLAPSVLLLAGLWSASRSVMAMAAAWLPYARATEGGLASAFRDCGRPAPAQRWRRAGQGAAPCVVGAGLSAGCLVAWHPLGGGMALASGLVAAGAVLWLALRRLGGFTGDVLGAAGVVLETVGLVVAAARW